MRGILRPVALVLTLAVWASVGWAGPSVVAAYQNLRASGMAPDLTYALRQSGAGWVTTSPDWGTDIPVQVDGPNGWMRLLDEGTGGGSYDLQVVLWREDDGLLLGIAESVMDPPYPGPSRVRFFGQSGGVWDDWTDYSWPGIGLADFLPDSATIGDLRALEAIRAWVHVTLPRHGTAIMTTLLVNDEQIAAVCEGQDWFVPANPMPYLRFCDRIEPVLARDIELDWLRDEGRFVAGPAR